MKADVKKLVLCGFREGLRKIDCYQFDANLGGAKFAQILQMRRAVDTPENELLSTVRHLIQIKRPSRMCT